MREEVGEGWSKGGRQKWRMKGGVEKKGVERWRVGEEEGEEGKSGERTREGKQRKTFIT